MYSSVIESYGNVYYEIPSVRAFYCRVAIVRIDFQYRVIRITRDIQESVEMRHATIYLQKIRAVDGFRCHCHWLHLYIEHRFARTCLARLDDDGTDALWKNNADGGKSNIPDQDFPALHSAILCAGDTLCLTEILAILWEAVQHNIVLVLPVDRELPRVRVELVLDVLRYRGVVAKSSQVDQLHFRRNPHALTRQVREP